MRISRPVLSRYKRNFLGLDMLKIILQDLRLVAPFNERARDLRVQNKPVWLAQRDVLAPYTRHEIELPPDAEWPDTKEACLVYRDNLFFDENFVKAFLAVAKRRKKPSRAAFPKTEPANSRALSASIGFIYNLR